MDLLHEIFLFLDLRELLGIQPSHYEFPGVLPAGLFYSRNIPELANFYTGFLPEYLSVPLDRLLR